MATTCLQRFPIHNNIVASDLAAGPSLVAVVTDAHGLAQAVVAHRPARPLAIAHPLPLEAAKVLVQQLLLPRIEDAAAHVQQHAGPSVTTPAAAGPASGGTAGGGTAGVGLVGQAADIDLLCQLLASQQVQVEPVMDQVLYAMASLPPAVEPTPPPASPTGARAQPAAASSSQQGLGLRPAQPADAPLLVGWYDRFFADVGLAPLLAPGHAQGVVDDLLQHKHLWLLTATALAPAPAGAAGHAECEPGQGPWGPGGEPSGTGAQQRQVRGEEAGSADVPVCMVAFMEAPLGTYQSYRIVSVYTPDALQGRGHATAAVLRMCRHLLCDLGADSVVIIADRANPVAHRVYRDKCGFVERSRLRHVNVSR